MSSTKAALAAQQIGIFEAPNVLAERLCAQGARPNALQPLRRVERRDHDVLIAGTAAEIAGNGDPHLLFGRVGIVAQEFDQRGENSRRAEAALQAVIVAERLLQRMQLVGIRRDAFDGQNLVPVGLHGEHKARARRTAVEQNSAGAAHAVLAAEMGAGETKLMADEVRQRDAHRNGLPRSACR